MCVQCRRCACAPSRLANMNVTRAGSPSDPQDLESQD